jgi:hypothetical protein
MKRYQLAIVALTLMFLAGCQGSAQSIANDQANVAQAQANVQAQQNALAQAQAIAATQPSPQATAAIAQLQSMLTTAQASQTALNNKLASDVTTGSAVSGGIALGKAAASAIPEYGALIGAIIGAVGLAYGGQQKSAANTAQNNADTANASLVQHQVLVAALTGSAAPVTTAVSHPALIQPIAPVAKAA